MLVKIFKKFVDILLNSSTLLAGILQYPVLSSISTRKSSILSKSSSSLILIINFLLFLSSLLLYIISNNITSTITSSSSSFTSTLSLLKLCLSINYKKLLVGAYWFYLILLYFINIIIYLTTELFNNHKNSIKIFLSKKIILFSIFFKIKWLHHQHHH